MCPRRRGTSGSRLSLRDTWHLTLRARAAPGLCCGDHGGQLLNGQSFLCVTLGADALAAAARLLRTPHVFIYDAAVPNAARGARRANSTGAGACSARLKRLWFGAYERLCQHSCRGSVGLRGYGLGLASGFSQHSCRGSQQQSCL